MNNDVIVVGGGAAGMMAAVTAGRLGARVLLLERNDRLGKKLAITGKGRCNLTNHSDVDNVLKNVPRNSRFLYSALRGFTPADAEAFFEELGCAWKVERGNRVFPVSDSAASVIEALRRGLREAGVTVRQGRVRELLTANGAICGVRTDRETVQSPRVILATGGCSYPATGSTGDGYALAAALGHTVVPPRGSLVPMVEQGDWCARMQGLSLRNVNVTLYEKEESCHSEPGAYTGRENPSYPAHEKKVSAEFGELLFTHFGLSGPTVLSLSAHMVPEERYRVEIDLKPALDEPTLDARLLRDFAANRNRTFENALGGLFPKTMIPVIVARSGIPGDTRVHTVTKAQRRALLETTKHFSVEIAGLRPVAEAIVTAGGISVKELDPKTMQSKLVPGLYFAGEILDCDAYTGGYNLQIAWATGHAAGTACTA